MNRSESKYFATAVRMDEAFLELLEKKDLAFITVKEICEKAGVNRSTFYLHYETIGDLLEECTRHIIDKFVEHMPYDTGEFIEKLQSRPLEELYLVTPEYLAPYLNYIKEHKRIWRTVYEQSSVLGMNNAYLALHRHVFTPIMERFDIPPAEQKYLMPFYINGLMGIIKEWLKEDCEDSVEHIISVIQLCVTDRKFLKNTKE